MVDRRWLKPRGRYVQAVTAGSACVCPFTHPMLGQAKFVLKAIRFVFWAVDKSVPVLLPEVAYSFRVSHEQALTVRQFNGCGAGVLGRRRSGGVWSHHRVKGSDV